MLNISFLPNCKYNMDFLFRAAQKRMIEDRIDQKSWFILSTIFSSVKWFIYQRNFFD